MNTTPLRVSTPRDVLALVPFALGFRPARSVVIICVRADGTLGMTARFDLADALDSSSRPATVRALARRALADGVTVAYVATYTAQATPEVREATRDVAAHLADEVTVPGVWVVTPERYYDVGCDDPECCIPGGRPVADLEASPIAATLVMAGHAPADSAEVKYALPERDETRRRLVQRSASRFDRARVEAQADGPWALRTWRTAALTAWRDVVEAGRAARPAQVGRVAAGLSDSLVRDAVLVWAFPGGDCLGPAVIDGRPHVGWDPVADALSRVVRPDSPLIPDRVRVAGALDALGDVAVHCQAERSVPALTIAGFLAWWMGDFGLAARRVDTVLRRDQSHPLAGLLAEALAVGLVPGWIEAGASRQRMPGTARLR